LDVKSEAAVHQVMPHPPVPPLDFSRVKFGKPATKGFPNGKGFANSNKMTQAAQGHYVTCGLMPCFGKPGIGPPAKEPLQPSGLHGNLLHENAPSYMVKDGDASSCSSAPYTVGRPVVPPTVSNKVPSHDRNCRTCDFGDLCDDRGDEYSVLVRHGAHIDDECHAVTSPITFHPNGPGRQNNKFGIQGSATTCNSNQFAGHASAAAWLPDQGYKMQHHVPHSNAATSCGFQSLLVV